MDRAHRIFWDGKEESGGPSRPPGGTVQERIQGTTYVNESYRFQLFKPPTWRILEQAARSIPSAVTVLGTRDETTMLVVGSVLYEGPPSAYAEILVSALRMSYSEFVAKPEDRIRVAGRPAIRRRFSGMAAGHEWHGLVVNLTDGPAHYGLIGVTRHELSGVQGKRAVQDGQVLPLPLSPSRTNSAGAKDSCGAARPLRSAESFMGRVPGRSRGLQQIHRHLVREDTDLVAKSQQALNRLPSAVAALHRVFVHVHPHELVDEGVVHVSRKLHGVGKGFFPMVQGVLDAAAHE